MPRSPDSGVRSLRSSRGGPSPGTGRRRPGPAALTGASLAPPAGRGVLLHPFLPTAPPVTGRGCGPHVPHGGLRPHGVHTQRTPRACRPDPSRAGLHGNAVPDPAWASLGWGLDFQRLPAPRERADDQVDPEQQADREDIRPWGLLDLCDRSDGVRGPENVIWGVIFGKALWCELSGCD